MQITLLDIEKMSTNQDNAAMFINSEKGKRLAKIILSLYNMLDESQLQEAQHVGLFR